MFNMKIPIKNPEKVANTIGYIFVSEQNIGFVAHLLEYGVLCIKPEFIGDYLIKVRRWGNMDEFSNFSIETHCDTSLEPSHRAGSNGGPQSIFYVIIRKIIPVLFLLPLLISSSECINFIVSKYWQLNQLLLNLDNADLP